MGDERGRRWKKNQKKRRRKKRRKKMRPKKKRKRKKRRAIKGNWSALASFRCREKRFLLPDIIATPKN